MYRFTSEPLYPAPALPYPTDRTDPTDLSTEAIRHVTEHYP